MKLELVNFKQAKDLMKLGYPQLSADYSYSASGDELVHFVDSEDYVISAPSLELAAKWLREEKDLFVHVDYTFNAKIPYDSEICKTSGMTCFVGWHNTYEEALPKGIDKAINLLKEK